MNAFLVAWRISRFLPVWLIRCLAGIGAWVAWLRHGKGVRRLEDNYRRVTGLEGRALRRLSRKGMASAAYYYSEVLELGRLKESVIDARCRMIGEKEAQAALQEKGRIVTALGHSGNWDIVGAFTCRNLATVTTVAEVLEPREAFEEFLRLREKVGMRVIPLEGHSTFRRLVVDGKKHGGVLALLADRDLSGSGVPVEMWGQRVKVAPGPAALALATDTALIPLTVYYERLRGRKRWAARTKWGTVMDFWPAVPVPSGAKTERVPIMTQAWAGCLAEGIAEHPEDWHMIQRFGWVE